jgi:tRNA dimethylallyltransferase
VGRRGVPRAVTKLDYEVVAIFGPTASGKSAVARSVADALATEVVSADALQVYRGLPILTNQPPEETHLVRICELAESMSVGRYAPLAHQTIDRLVDAHSAAVVAGGTGLYLRAALVDLRIPPTVEPDVRNRAELLYDTSAKEAYAVLAELDPPAAASLHPNDRRRVVRALELARVGASLAPPSARLWAGSMRRPTAVFGLDVLPDVLNRRIAERTDEMIRRGVVDEVRRALRTPISHTARKALGLDEIGTLPVAEARDRIVARTRRYAAYQRKWMRRIPDIVMLDADRPADQVADEIVDVARAR